MTSRFPNYQGRPGNRGAYTLRREHEDVTEAAKYHDFDDECLSKAPSPGDRLRT